jgi:hypothetical protein
MHYRRLQHCALLCRRQHSLRLLQRPSGGDLKATTPLIPTPTPTPTPTEPIRLVVVIRRRIGFQQRQPLAQQGRQHLRQRLPQRRMPGMTGVWLHYCLRLCSHS